MSNNLNLKETEALKRYLNEISCFGILTQDAEDELIAQKEAGKLSARKKLIESNLSFVVTIAKEYLNKGLEVLDVIQEGNLGLIEGVDKYKQSLDKSFQEVIEENIRLSIENALKELELNDELPIQFLEQNKQIEDEIKRLTQELQREPEIEEVAKSLNLDVDTIRKIQEISKEIISLGGNEVNKADKKEESLTDQDKVVELLSCLNKQEKNVIESLFGLNGKEVKTLENLAKEMSISASQVQQIKENALLKMKNEADTSGPVGLSDL